MKNYYSSIVQKVWNYAHVLENAGVGYRHHDHRIELICYLPTRSGAGGAAL